TAANQVTFRFVVDSELMSEPLIIPFTFYTADYVDTDDNVLPHVSVSAVGHNYPNPFNPHTQINYYLEENKQASLVIYNTKGQVVKTFTDINQGRHNVDWNGTDESGQTVGSGVYYYKLTGIENSPARKMMLLK
ncbi:MAG: FlgD immunoglobulin-like domain containing protein, partial [Candidatus Cloacimonetes bacterium]|nr:FlgD immunoglobulin-like domain containing protein [Candidatus Cloacimonadota bacterium]